MSAELINELRARAVARHSGESISPTAALCRRAADWIESLEREVARLKAELASTWEMIDGD